MSVQEEWKDIKITRNGKIHDYTGMYMISNTGKVFSIKKGALLKARRQDKDYLEVVLYKNGDGQAFYIHRLVANAFLDNPNNYQQVNHKDENTHNNYVDNLEWCDQSYNINYGTRNERVSEKLRGENNPNAKKVKCVETGRIFNTIKEASDWLETNSKNPSSKIVDCCKGKRKTAYGFHWEYVYSE